MVLGHVELSVTLIAVAEEVASCALREGRSRGAAGTGPGRIALPPLAAYPNSDHVQPGRPWNGTVLEPDMVEPSSKVMVPESFQPPR